MLRTRRTVATLTVAAAATAALAGLGVGSQVSAAPVPGSFAALDFDGVNDNVSFGNAASLRLGTFTLETWFMRQGQGKATTTTGAGDSRGFSNATTDGVIPLVAKGRAQSEKSTKDLNYLLGIHTSGVLGGDFEEAGTTPNPGANHKILGTTVVPYDSWHHAALTYDGNTLSLYFDGSLERSDTIGRPPRSDSIQWASLGSALNSSGQAAGFFAGVIDEARIWNRALTPAELTAGMAAELTSGNGLVARWGLNDGNGTTVRNSVGQANGTARNGPVWVDGHSSIPPNAKPDQPELVSPDDGAGGVGIPAPLSVRVSDPDGDPLDVTFFGRPATAGGGPNPFTIAVLPDTQHYSNSRPATYLAQTNWIVANRGALDIRFVAHLGDIVDNRDAQPAEWQAADAAHDVLDAAAMPYAVVPGNKDISSSGVAALFDTYFRPSRFAGKPWYLGYLGDSISGDAEGTGADSVGDAGIDRLNKDSYQVVDAAGVRLVFINIEQDMPPYAVSWAQRVIDAEMAVDPDTEFVVVTHNYLKPTGGRANGTWQRPDGMTAEQVWQTLIRPNCNIHLVMNGHYTGEARRTDPNACGEPVHQVLSDYQNRVNGGNGWLRYLTFRPADDAIDFFTYSPTLGQFENDADSRFTLSLQMSGQSVPFQQLGAVDDVAPGAVADQPWPGLDAGSTFEWYVVVSDAASTTTSPRWTFTAAP